KSLVVIGASGNRYGFLETVRQYAQDRLHETGRRDTVAARHLRFYIEFAELARPGLVGPEQGRWLSALDREHENLLAAHAACDRVANGEAMGLRLVIAAKLYWGYRGHLDLGYRLTVEALARSRHPRHDGERCRALHNAGQFALFMGRYFEA